MKSVSLIDGGKSHHIFLFESYSFPLSSITHVLFSPPIISAFEAIISNNLRKMVTYNATTALMPFYYHQFHDDCSMHDIDGESQVSQIDDSMFSSSQFTSCLTGSQDDNHSHFQRPANLRSIWDLRLVSWMLRPDVSDDQIEWSTFKSGFPHLVADSIIVSCDSMPIVSRGLNEARTDLMLLYSLYPLINEQLIRQDLLRSLENIESPVQSILTSMECRGVGFYPQRLKRVESQLSARIGELEARSRAVTNDSDFLLSSPQQVSQYLFDTLRLNVPEGLVSKTKSSHRSTSEEALKAIKSDAIARTGSAPEILDTILEFRTLSKLLTTYIRPLPRLCVRGEGKSKKTPSRIHPQWMMTAVRTGRLSCRKPNLQQLPSDAGEINIYLLHRGLYFHVLTKLLSHFFSIRRQTSRCIRPFCERRNVCICV